MTQAVLANYEYRLTADIASGWGLVGNINLVSGQGRPQGYPPGPIQHWVDMQAYNGSGANTTVEDPASGMGGVWSQVKPYWSANSGYFVGYVDNRGYIW